jgi:2-polyprenyl-3-methyl-5-hydroxy-6-metoxy-1,4-benzoquinol methylase
MKTESDFAISQHHNRKKSYDKIKDYHKQYIDEKTGLVFENKTIKRKCPVCTADNFRTLFHKSGGTYVKCNECTMVYLNRILNPEELTNYYIHLDTGQGDNVEREADFYREIYGLGLQKISKFGNMGNLLDIGCSTGFFLDMVKHDGWNTFGIELGEEEGQRAIDKGHTIYRQLINKLNTDEKYDAITMWDVFEHIPDGKSTLNAISSFLNPNGVLFMQIPNSGSIATRIMQDESHMFDGIEHVNLYNPETIKLIVQNNGFEILSLETVISELAVLKNYLNYEDPYFGKEKGADFLGLLDGNEVNRNLLGYKIQILLRKI